MESKKLCFQAEHILEINYGIGSHSCNPVGNIKYSLNAYINKHMNNLGLLYVNGHGVEQNVSEAIKWWKYAADQGNVNAQTKLSMLKNIGGY